MYYDHATALQLELGRWSKGRELKGFERELQAMSEAFDAHRSPVAAQWWQVRVPDAIFAGRRLRPWFSRSPAAR